MTMPEGKLKPAAESFVKLLRQQIEFLQDGDYEYESLDIYTEVDPKNWTAE
jgi:hypothetical protein